MVRQLISEKPAVGYAIAGGILVLAIALVFILGAEEEAGRDVSFLWFYDLNTKERFPVKRVHGSLDAPQPAPSGTLQADNGPLKKGDPAGVRLYLYACDSCDNEKFIGYLHTYTVSYRDAILDGTADPEKRAKNVFFKRESDTEWYSDEAPEKRAILTELPGKCPGKKLVRCEVNATKG